MSKGDVICPTCKAGFRRIELVSRNGSAGDVRCPLCSQAIEVLNGSSEVVDRVTIAPENLFG
jgi:predicted Zn finger-like uncharacterized protein